MRLKWFIAVIIIISMFVLVGCNSRKVEDSSEEESKNEVIVEEESPKSEAPMDHPFYKTIDRKGYSLEDDLNIRDQGGMEGQILTAIQKGDEVHVLGYREGWYHVRYGRDQEGWIYAKYIQLEAVEGQEEAQQVEPKPQKKQEVVQGSKSNAEKKIPTGTPEKEKNQLPDWSDEELSWYFSRRSDHKQPGIGSTHRTLLEQYGGIALGSSHSKDIYLTFDNGYENGYTTKILDILKENEVVAAFFVLGTYIDSNPDIIRRMAKEGHLVVNHTNNHPKMTDLSDELLTNEIQEVEYKYKALTGKEMPKFLRPPAGVFSERTLALTQQLGYRTVFWSMAYRDWVVDDQPGKDVAYRHVMDNIHNGAVILLHAVSESNTEALDDIIKGLKAQGYRFKGLDEFK